MLIVNLSLTFNLITWLAGTATQHTSGCVSAGPGFCSFVPFLYTMSRKKQTHRKMACYFPHSVFHFMVCI